MRNKIAGDAKSCDYEIESQRISWIEELRK
jgi:hypothetical protein